MLSTLWCGQLTRLFGVSALWAPESDCLTARSNRKAAPLTLTVKTIRASNRGERFSQIARNPPHSEIVGALIAIGRDSCSINFPRGRLFTQPRPEEASL